MVCGTTKGQPALGCTDGFYVYTAALGSFPGAGGTAPSSGGAGALGMTVRLYPICCGSLVISVDYGNFQKEDGEPDRSKLISANKN